MFTFLKLFQKRGVLLNANGTRSISISSSTNNTTTNSFTVSYLINSCGLSPQQALSTSHKFKGFETSSKPDSVLTLLKSHGFTNTHISKFVQRRPLLLLADPDKTLKPKFDYFRSIGFSDPDLAHILSRDPTVLGYSLNNQIVPSIDFLKNILKTEANVVKLLKRSTWALKGDIQNHMAPNIEVLRAHGVPQSIILNLLATHRLLLLNAHRFKEVVQEVKELGFDPLKYTFVMGVKGLNSMSKSLWETKVEAYKKWGWSEEEIRTAFLKHPICMIISVKKIISGMDFFVNKMGRDPALIAKHPVLLCYSVEKRIIPRCLVLDALISKGLVKKDISLNTVMAATDKYFLENFVTKFQDQVPEISNVYKAKVNV